MYRNLSTRALGTDQNHIIITVSNIPFSSHGPNRFVGRRPGIKRTAPAKTIRLGSIRFTLVVVYLNIQGGAY